MKLKSFLIFVLFVVMIILPSCSSETAEDSSSVSQGSTVATPIEIELSIQVMETIKDSFNSVSSLGLWDDIRFVRYICGPDDVPSKTLSDGSSFVEYVIIPFAAVDTSMLNKYEIVFFIKWGDSESECSYSTVGCWEYDGNEVAVDDAFSEQYEKFSEQKTESSVHYVPKDTVASKLDIQNYSESDFVQTETKAESEEDHISLAEHYLRGSSKSDENSGEQETISHSPTLGERNALKKAKSYISVGDFSYSSLIEQLEYEGYSHDEAIYGADNCGADWNAEAAGKANSYMDAMAFSRKGLIDQLLYEGFTQEQAEYGAASVGY